MLHNLNNSLYQVPCWEANISSASQEIVKFSRYRPGVAQRVGRGIALLFHDRGTRRGWMISSTPRPHFTSGKDLVPILQKGGWAPGPVWTGGKSRPHQDSIPDRPARTSVAIPTELPGPQSNTPHFMKPEGSLPRSPKPTTVPIMCNIIGIKISKWHLRSFMFFWIRILF